MNTAKLKNKDALQWNLLKDRSSMIVFLSSFFMAMGSLMITPVIPEIISFFKISEVKASLVISLFTFPTIIISPVIGSLADSYGRRIFFSLGMLIFGIAGVLPVVLKLGYNCTLFFRTIQGIGYAAVMPLTITVLGDLHEGSQEVAAQGIRAFFIGMGGFIFPLLGGTLAAFGWNYPFLCYSITIPFAYFIWRNLPESNKYVSVNTGNKRFILNELMVIKNSHILIVVLISNLIRFFLFFGVKVYLPILLVNRFEITLAMAGLILGIMEFIKSITSFQVGFIANKWGLITPLIFGFLAYGIGSFILPISPSVAIIFFIMMLLGLGDGILAPLQKSLITQNVPDEKRAGIVSINASLQTIGITISPIIVGIIMVNYGLNWAFWFLTIFASISLFYFLLKKEQFN